MPLKTSLVSTILVAMPHLQGELAKSVILICGHDDNGAVGLVINRKIPSLYMDDLLEQLKIPVKDTFPKRVPIFVGGEHDMGRGFVLHSNDYKHEQTIPISDSISLTATLDILNQMASGTGPKRNFLGLGYTNWDKGQLEQELKDNKWLWLPCSDTLVFDDQDDKWETLIRQVLGVNGRISMDGGRC